MRLFIALDIPADVRTGLNSYMEGARSLAAEARWDRVEGLHVTLKFLGHVDDVALEHIKAALRLVKSPPFEVKFAGVGFFPNPNAGRVFWAGVDGGDHLPRLASSIDAALEKLGFQPETKPYHPHLTLARTSSRPLRGLKPLLDEPPPQFGTMTAREFFLYQSQPQKGGSKYTKLERFVLR